MTLLSDALARYHAEHPQRTRDPDIPDFLLALIEEIDYRLMFEARRERFQRAGSEAAR